MVMTRERSPSPPVPGDSERTQSSDASSQALHRAGQSAVERIAQAPSPTEKIASLWLCATTSSPDRTRLSLTDIKNQALGHSFLALQLYPGRTPPPFVGAPTRAFFDTPSRTSTIGFHPAGKASANPLDSYTPGIVEEPEDGYRAKGSEQYELTTPQLEAFLGYVNPRRSAPYSPFFYNCTTFALGALHATGNTAPAGEHWRPVEMPNDVYERIVVDEHAGAKDRVAREAPLGVMHDASGKAVPESESDVGVGSQRPRRGQAQVAAGAGVPVVDELAPWEVTDLSVVATALGLPANTPNEAVGARILSTPLPHLVDALKKTTVDDGKELVLALIGIGGRMSEAIGRVFLASNEATRGALDQDPTEITFFMQLSTIHTDADVRWIGENVMPTLNAKEKNVVLARLSPGARARLHSSKPA